MMLTIKATGLKNLAPIGLVAHLKHSSYVRADNPYANPRRDAPCPNRLPAYLSR